MGNPSSCHFFYLILTVFLANAPISSSIRPEVAGLLSDHQKGCPSSSCGNLTNILYPFRLSSDPSRCGDYESQLVCEAGHAILLLSGLKLFVKDISYIDNTMFVSYYGTAPSNFCSLPDGINNSESIISYPYEFSGNWATFINCTQKIVNQNYMEVPCLSDKYTTVYVIVGEYANELIYLPNNCYAMEYYLIGKDIPSSGMQVVQLFQLGFQLHWDNYADEQINHKELGFEITRCWAYATAAAKYETDGFSILHKMVLFPIRFEAEFVGCFFAEEGDKNDSHVIFSVIFIIFLQLFIVLSGWVAIYKFILGPLVACAFLLYNYQKNKVHVGAIEKFLRKQQTLSPTRYTYGELTALSGHFKEKLGQGGFGSVFKGELPGGRLVAIKLLHSNNFSGEEFINEVSTIGRIHHVNIVQLLGFCFEGTKRALIYEYMPNGSLDKYIFTSKRSKEESSLSSKQLNSIALGVAKGIDYLHYGCDMQILHFDIKPHNILLDQNFCPKISDFGLAKLYPKDHSIVSISAARGTIGYIAPELISRNFGLISYKSDVYSFGMLLMEIAGRRRNVDQAANCSSQIYYPSWIYDQLSQLEVPKFEYNILELEKKLCKVGLWCIQMNPSKRPSMSNVIEMLQADEVDIPLAPKPFVSSPETTSSYPQSNMYSTSIELSVIEEHNLLEISS